MERCHRGGIFSCHRERSAAILGERATADADCRVAALLAMTWRGLALLAMTWSGVIGNALLCHCERSEAILG